MKMLCCKNCKAELWQPHEPNCRYLSVSTPQEVIPDDCIDEQQREALEDGKFIEGEPVIAVTEYAKPNPDPNTCAGVIQAIGENEIQVFMLDSRQVESYPVDNVYPKIDPDEDLKRRVEYWKERQPAMIESLDPNDAED